MNQKGFSNIALVIVIVALIIVGGGYFLLTKQQIPATQQTTPPPTPTATQNQSPQQQTITLPSITFTVSRTSGVIPLTITTSKLDACKFYKIDWGDGQTSTSYNAQRTCEYQKELLGTETHTYNSPGTYTVKVFYGTELFGTVIVTATNSITNSGKELSELVSITLPSYCSFSGNTKKGWIVDCGKNTKNDARGFMGKILEPQGWKFCDSGLAHASWWKNGVITGVSESENDSSAASYPFRVSQSTGAECQ